MSGRHDVSRLIIAEIEADTQDETLRILAEEILKYELENWRSERPKFASSYEALIEKAVRRRRRRNEDTVNSD